MAKPLPPQERIPMVRRELQLLEGAERAEEKGRPEEAQALVREEERVEKQNVGRFKMPLLGYAGVFFLIAGLVVLYFLPSITIACSEGSVLAKITSTATCDATLTSIYGGMALVNLFGGIVLIYQGFIGVRRAA